MEGGRGTDPDADTAVARLERGYGWDFYGEFEEAAMAVSMVGLKGCW